jgi:hypothetical protein
LFYIQSSSPEDWRKLLAQPEKQWKDGYSAKELAEAWQNSSGFPECVKAVLIKSGIAGEDKIEFIQGLPEFKVALPGGNRASQTDLFVLAKLNGELVTIMIEGKHNEPFGPTIRSWTTQSPKSIGKEKRLDYLKSLLEIGPTNVDDLRYQLFHRTASAILTAKKYNTKKAIMMVHSFSLANDSYLDFADFANRLGYAAGINNLTDYKEKSGVQLSLGWVNDMQINEYTAVF